MTPSADPGTTKECASECDLVGSNGKLRSISQKHVGRCGWQTGIKTVHMLRWLTAVRGRRDVQSRNKYAK